MKMFISRFTINIPTAERAAGSAPRGMDMAFMTVCMIFASVIITLRALAKPTSSAEYVIVFAPAANDFSIWSGVMPPMMPDAKARIIMQAPS